MNFQDFSEKWNLFWYEKRDSIRLKVFQCTLGISLLLYLMNQWQWKEEWLTCKGYHLSPELLSQTYYLPPVPLIPSEYLSFLGILGLGILFCLISGIGGRFIVFLAFLLITYPTTLDPVSSFTINLLFVGSLFILTFAPFSGGWIQLKTMEPHVVWPERMLQLTLIITYFFSGWKKAVEGGWIETPDILFTQVQGHYRTDLAAWFIGHLPPEAWFLMQISVIIFELGAPYFFTHPKFRPWAVAYGIIFHLAIALLMHKLIFFSLQMICFLLLFIPREKLRSLVSFHKTAESH